jgi:DNA-binding MarR family transcriptional regulator
MKREETIDYHIKSAWHAIARMYNREAAKFGGTMAIGYVLLNIDTKLGTPATKIGPMLGLEARSLTRTLKNLEDAGLIYRKKDTVDGRSVRIYLTPEGRAKRRLSRETVISFNEAVRESIPESKLKVVFEVMSEISRIVEKEEIFSNVNKVEKV